MITVDELTFSYAGARQPAAKKLCFEVREGEIFGLLGPSGAGKTTAQNVLIGLLTGYKGRVNVMGQELAEWDRSYYERIGVSFEFPNHYLKLTARENLEYFRSLYDSPTETPETVLKMVGLEEYIDVRVGNFSKGMKNRLNFARSLLHRPKLLFLDEPTAGLDPVNSRRIREVVKLRQTEGVTSFLTTHDMITADALCDRVGFIVDGELKVVDTPGALKRRFGRPAVRVEVAADGKDAETREFPLKGLGDNVEFLALIREHDPETIHSQETSLETVFVAVTGRTLT